MPVSHYCDHDSLFLEFNVTMAGISEIIEIFVLFNKKKTLALFYTLTLISVFSTKIMTTYPLLTYLYNFYQICLLTVGQEKASTTFKLIFPSAR